MHDPHSQRAWNRHRIWQAIHRHRQEHRSDWTSRDWDRAQRLTEIRRETHPSGLYLYDAEWALRQTEYLRALREFEKQTEVDRMVHRLLLKP